MAVDKGFQIKVPLLGHELGAYERGVIYHKTEYIQKTG